MTPAAGVLARRAPNHSGNPKMSDDKQAGVNTSVEENQTDARERRARGEFVRGVSGFRSHIGDDPDFPAEPGRYHLYVALNCPWCHRVTLARNVLGLQDTISMDVAFPTRTGEGDPAGPNLWEFAPFPRCSREWNESPEARPVAESRRSPRFSGFLRCIRANPRPCPRR